MPVHLESSGDFDFEVVGESHYQDALSAICGGRCEEGVDHECVAQLVREPNNPYDPNAVAVLIDGRKVAHLSRDDAADWQDQLRARGLVGRVVTCDALICGGWDRGGRDRGHFGVKLDLSWRRSA